MVEARHFEIVLTSDPLTPDGYRSTLRSSQAGALSEFLGVVRDHHQGREVSAIDYEAYPDLCHREAKTIFAICRQKFEILKAAAVHRIGRCQVGEPSIWIGVSAAHRGPAFEACRFLIDTFKERLPIWKREWGKDGKPLWMASEPSSFAKDRASGNEEPLELEIPRNEGKAWLSGFVLCDVRESLERFLSPLPLKTDLHLPLSEFPSWVSSLQKDQRYLLICAAGIRSLHLTEQLRLQGFSHVYSLKGGLPALKNSGVLLDVT